MSKREDAITALYNMLQGVPGLLVKRGGTEPEEIPQEGLAIIRDGDPGEPDITMSPLLYHYRHRVVIEVMVQHPDAATRDQKFDDLLATIAGELALDRSLGGAVDWVETEAPVVVDEAVIGGPGIKAAEVGVALIYSTPDPLT